MLDKKVFMDNMLSLEITFNIQVTTASAFDPESVELKKRKIDIWYNAVKHIPNNYFSLGVKKLIGECVYNEIKPAHLKQACTYFLKQNTLSVDDAYRELESSFAKYYHGHPQGCKDAMNSYSPIVRKIVERHGGFYKLSMMQGVERDIFEREFKKEIETEVSIEVQTFLTQGACALEFKDVKLLEG